MAKGDFGFAARTNLDPRLQRDLPAMSISEFMLETQRQLRAGWISPEQADDAVRKLRAEMITHRLENGNAADTAQWIEMSPQQRQAELDATQGLSNTRETPEAIERRQQLALDRVAANAATVLTDRGVVSPKGFNEFWRTKAPEPYRALRKRIGLGKEHGIDGEMRSLTEAEELKLARALAALDRGEDVPAEAPPPEPARPGPRSYARSRSEFSDFNMREYCRRRDKEEAEAKRREAYEDVGEETDDDAGPTEL
jgi:hypothetical protein